jgi:hypothetical protein
MGLLRKISTEIPSAIKWRTGTYSDPPNTFPDGFSVTEFIPDGDNPPGIAYTQRDASNNSAVQYVILTSGFPRMQYRLSVGGLNIWDEFRPLMTQGDFTHNLLWSGSSYPNGSTTITPTLPLSACVNGWILEWSDYDAGTSTTNDFNFAFSFIPKSFPELYNGKGIMIPIGASVSSDQSIAPFITVKQLYIYDDRIVGHDLNRDSYWANDVVLRKIYAY